ncbi:MAG: hypothetical protein JWP89_6650 [Schlesneria sp.]|nr:hypothetical protein [Schlesneria sp.]
MATHAEAESRVKLLFWIHLAVYFVAITGMVFLNYTQSPDKKWALWVALGWGAGIVLHGALLYFSQTREKAIARTLDRMNRRSK